MAPDFCCRPSIIDVASMGGSESNVPSEAFRADLLPLLFELRHPLDQEQRRLSLQIHNAYRVLNVMARGPDTTGCTNSFTSLVIAVAAAAAAAGEVPEAGVDEFVSK